jgi:hypothetical protein
MRSGKNKRLMSSALIFAQLIIKDKRIFEPRAFPPASAEKSAFACANL